MNSNPMPDRNKSPFLQPVQMPRSHVPRHDRPTFINQSPEIYSCLFRHTFPGSHTFNALETLVLLADDGKGGWSCGL